MTEILPWLLVAIPVVVVALLLLRRRASTPADGEPREYGADLIVDQYRKRLYLAMKRYFLEERRSEEEWRAFEFLDELPKGAMKNRAELQRKLAARFKIDPAEAGRRLERVLEGIQKVKQRSRSGRE